MLGIFSGISCLTVNWTAIHVSRGGTLASNAAYQEFLAASTKDSMNQDPSLRIRVDANGNIEAPPKRRGPVTGILEATKTVKR